MLPDSAVFVPPTADSAGRTSPLTRPRRVGYVTKMFPRFSETFILTELLQVERLGVDVEVFSLRPPTDGRFHAGLADLRAPVSYLRSSGIRAADLWAALAETAAEFGDLGPQLADLLRLDVRDALQAAELARLVRQRGITHLHAHFASAGAGVARAAAAIAGIGYGFTAHAKDIFFDYDEPQQLDRKLADAAFAVTVSDFNLRHLQASVGSPAGRLVRLYNGVDLERFRFQAPGDGPPTVLAVGRLVEKKGFAVLIEAAATLRDRGLALRCDIIGDGPDRDALAQRIRAAALDQQVQLVGARAQQAVIEAMRRATVLAMPCIVSADGNRDGLPTVLIEAMALGTPVIGTTVTGIPELVRDGRTGLCVPPGDPLALADALERLLLDRALRQRLARAAREAVCRDFDIDRNARQLRALFRDAIAHQPERRS